MDLEGARVGWTSDEVDGKTGLLLKARMIQLYECIIIAGQYYFAKGRKRGL